ncbi:MAG: threonyl-tRNA synthetase editing domain-containing protein [Deltaproteobacteria bacterium]|nr:MAG: threonyl-tRNA synthetase editing domain-containing protein [Deltaproteobacteria bacterium]
MKVLLFYAPSFWFKTYQKVLEQVPDQDLEVEREKAVVVFYHVEAEDLERRGKVLSKFIKNIKWLAGKFDSRTVVLHSFNHLSSSKAPADFAGELVREAIERLERTGYSVTATPFGYLNEWKLHVAGESLAKVFKEI